MEKIADTLNMYIIAEMTRINESASFDYYEPFIENNQIKVLPKDDNTYFSDAYLWPSFVESDNVEDYKRIFGLNLTVNVEYIDENNCDYRVSTNDFGELIISFDANDENPSVIIAGVSMNTNAVLEEELEETDAEDSSAESEEAEAEEVAPDTSSIEAQVLTEDEMPEEGPAWIVTYDLNSVTEALNEDEEENSTHQEVIVAPDIETAVKYAEQNARIQGRENPNWHGAEIVSIKKKIV